MMHLHNCVAAVLTFKNDALQWDQPPCDWTWSLTIEFVKKKKEKPFKIKCSPLKNEFNLHSFSQEKKQNSLAGMGGSRKMKGCSYEIS